MKHSHRLFTRLFTVFIMLGIVIGLFSTPAFITHNSVVQAQEENPTLTPEPATEPVTTPTAETTPIPPMPETPSDGFKWELDFVNFDSELTAQSAEFTDMVGGLSAEGVMIDQSVDQVRLTGNNDLEQLRAAVFDNISPWADFLGGPVEITLYLPSDGNEVSLTLEARTTTGYQWEVQSVDDVTVEISQTEFQPYYRGIGASALETIHIKGRLTQLYGLSTNAHLVWKNLRMRA